ncbi:unnamed protein product [Blepharisma stoltei]|uniref:GTP-binding protein sar1 n=1 Tax=Blepharisma stoltei TaxID=1481888 RepID=A0AAU9JC05_9CILI|nr:unnamed protein product [Blepharisma stoltei]
MFLLNWFYSALGYLGLYYKNAKLVFLGLDNAGKSTLLKMLKDDKAEELLPTIHPQSEELVMGSIRFHTVDLGGHEIARKIWTDYLGLVDGIVFVVDSSDRERFELAKSELDGLLKLEELQDVPFAILGNKIDLDEAANEDELRLELGLQSYGFINKSGKHPEGLRPVELFMCSVRRRTGYVEAFRWLSQFLK